MILGSGTSHDRLQEPDSDYAPPEGGEKPSEKTRVIFIPWPENSPQAGEWKQKSEQWNHVKGENKQFDIVYYQKGQTSEALTRVTNDPNGVVYVRGHGGPGAPGLLTKIGEKFETLTMEEVCERLESMGLGQAFEGSIKFHSCYSGTVFTPEIYQRKQQDSAAMLNRIDRVLVPMKQKLIREGIGDPKTIKGMDEYRHQRSLLRPTATSMAKQGADHLRGRGFQNCRYYGYLGPVESTYGVDCENPKPEDWHKHVDLEGLQEPTFQLPGGTNIHRVRASVARIRIR